MSNHEPSEPGPISADYDITRLLEYTGPSTRQPQPIEEGISLLDYRNTEANERNISTLLSAQSIPFQIERPKLGPRIRLVVTVPRDLRRQAEALLSAAARASAVDVVEGTEGLFSR